MSDRPSIETEALTKRYGAKTAVGELDLAVTAGTVYGFLGPNGAGKTTTIRLLTGLLDPSSGTGTVDGQPITEREALLGHIGYLPETPPLYNELTAREQLEYTGGLHGMAESVIREGCSGLVERLALADAVDDRIATYSKGMRQKTGLIQAIMHDPAVVFLDEPFGGLDPRATRTVRELVTELADDGTTVFLSTHVLPVVDRLAHEVGVLYRGSLVAEGPPETVKNRMESERSGTLEDAFLELTTEEPVSD